VYSTHKVEVPEKGNSRVPGTLIKRFVIVLPADKKKPRRAPFKGTNGGAAEFSLFALAALCLQNVNSLYALLLG